MSLIVFRKMICNSKIKQKQHTNYTTKTNKVRKKNEMIKRQIIFISNIFFYNKLIRCVLCVFLIFANKKENKHTISLYCIVNRLFFIIFVLFLSLLFIIITLSLLLLFHILVSSPISISQHTYVHVCIKYLLLLLLFSRFLTTLLLFLLIFFCSQWVINTQFLCIHRCFQLKHRTFILLFVCRIMNSYLEAFTA